jgi:hypothetical protein
MLFCGKPAFGGRSSVRARLSSVMFWLVVVCAAATAADAQETPESRFNSTSSRSANILEGNWQSCLERDTGRYGERVYDHVVNGVGQFEVHLGPGREFAIFAGVQDAHRNHAGRENLLVPFRVLLEGTRASKRWVVPSLNLAFTVTLGGGSRTDCESWFILLAPLDKTS